MPFFTCSLCLDDTQPVTRINKIDITDNDTICGDCFRGQIVPQIWDSIRTPGAEFPFKFGTTPIRFEDYGAHIPGYKALLRAYTSRKDELETPPAQRVYCHQEVQFLGPKKEGVVYECDLCGHEVCGNCGKRHIGAEHVCASLEDAMPGDKGRDYQLCPECGTVVALQDGCNSVKCVCGCQFCFLCGLAVNHNDRQHWQPERGICPRFGQRGSDGAMFDDEVQIFDGDEDNRGPQENDEPPEQDRHRGAEEAAAGVVRELEAIAEDTAFFDDLEPRRERVEWAREVLAVYLAHYDDLRDRGLLSQHLADRRQLVIDLHTNAGLLIDQGGRRFGFDEFIDPASSIVGRHERLRARVFQQRGERGLPVEAPDEITRARGLYALAEWYIGCTSLRGEQVMLPAGQRLRIQGQLPEDQRVRVVREHFRVQGGERFRLGGGGDVQLFGDGEVHFERREQVVVNGDATGPILFNRVKVEIFHEETAMIDHEAF